MFFAPPKVSTLSQYSDFGSHLQQRHFLMMVAAAVLLHAFIAYMYSLSPHEKPLIIPVRPLSIKLDSGLANGLDMPKPESMPGYQPPVIAQTPPQQAAIHVGETAREPAPEHTSHHEHGTGAPQKPLISIISQTGQPGPSLRNRLFPQPKKYVRASSVAEYDKTGKSHGNGTTLKGTPEGQQIVANYGQEIALWLQQHEIHPEATNPQMLRGSARVRIRIDRQGRILYSAIDASSGNQVLDQAAMQMVHNSNPVPPPPPNYPQDSELEFVIPINFTPPHS